VFDPRLQRRGQGLFHIDQEVFFGFIRVPEQEYVPFHSQATGAGNAESGIQYLYRPLSRRFWDPFGDMGHQFLFNSGGSIEKAYLVDPQLQFPVLPFYCPLADQSFCLRSQTFP